MSLPKLTKNEKIILASVIAVLTIFWIIVDLFVLIRTKELTSIPPTSTATSIYRLPTSSQTIRRESPYNNISPAKSNPNYPYSDIKRRILKYKNVGQSEKSELSINLPSYLTVKSSLYLDEDSNLTTIDSNGKQLGKIKVEKGWSLFNEESKEVARMIITKSSIQEARKMFPLVNFKKYSIDNTTGKSTVRWEGEYGAGEAIYIVPVNGTENVWFSVKYEPLGGIPKQIVKLIIDSIAINL